MAKIKFSVVIPTYNRRRLLKRCLKTLFSQTYPAKNFEIIVVDDGSTDGTENLVKKLAKKHQNLDYLGQKNQGPAVARNLGIKKAKGEIIVFTDDDCLPVKNWLAKIDLAFLKNPDALGVEGKTISDKQKSDLLVYSLINDKGGQYWTANIAYKKMVLEKVGGFDETFRFSHCEDIDLARKVLKRGEIVFNPETLVAHPTRKIGLFSGLKKLSHLGDEFRLYLKHEDYFSQFFPVKNKLAVFILMTYGNHIDYRLKLLKDSLGQFSQNPCVWFKFLGKNLLEIFYVALIFPKSVWRIRK